MNLNEIADVIEEELNDKESVRELAIKSSRAIIRLAAQSIMRMHRNENYEDLLREMKEEVWHLRSLLLRDYPDLFYAGFVQNALQEYCEALVFKAILNNEEMPSPKKLGINSEAYLMGIADVVGELRREVLESLKNEKIGQAERYLRNMEELYELLMRFNYPSGFLNIKPKQDMVRGLVEKTRGEFIMAIMNKKLQERIDSFFALKKE